MLGVKDTVSSAYFKVEEFFKRIVPKNGTSSSLRVIE